MQLNEQIKQQLMQAIKIAQQNGNSFPIEIQSGKIKHLISTEKLSTGYLLDTISADKKDYLIYLI